jgi:uncharacterized protein YbbK (DUF523 family)
MRILVSACLMGVPCRYDGDSRLYADVEKLLRRHTCIPICPEQMGGLPTPRPPAELRDGRVYFVDGIEVTAPFRRGAAAVLDLAKMSDCQAAVLKETSPSCGSGLIYDGTFSRRLIQGYGVTAEVLKAAGIRVYGESEIGKLLS